MLFQGRQTSLCVSGFPILKYERSPLPTDLCTSRIWKECVPCAYVGMKSMLCAVDLLSTAKPLGKDIIGDSLKVISGTF